MTSNTRTRSALGALTIAAAMAVTLVAPMPAFAQATATTIEESGESQMDMSLERFFEMHGIKTEVQKLTMGQIAAINAVVNSSDGSGNQKGRIEAIIADN